MNLDEMARFEEYIRKEHPMSIGHELKRFSLYPNRYEISFIQDKWQAWQARAELDPTTNPLASKETFK